MSLPINFMGREFAEAHLRIVEPPRTPTTDIPLQFNPTEYKITKENTFAEIPIPGLESPPLQYVRGGAGALTMDVLVDTSDTSRTCARSTSPRSRLRGQGREAARPADREFVWDRSVFHGVLTSLEITYLLFHTDGKPLRAKLGDDDEGVPAGRGAGQGDRADLAGRREALRRPRRRDAQLDLGSRLPRPRTWREIAVANGITDPRALAPGTVLTVPALAEGSR